MSLDAKQEQETAEVAASEESAHGALAKNESVANPNSAKAITLGVLLLLVALVAGALSTQDPGYATFTRVVLTLGGAFTAAAAVALLDYLTQWRKPEPKASEYILESRETL